MADQPINAILLSFDYPADPTMLILHGGSLLFTKDCGETWEPWQMAKHGELRALGEPNISAVLAPHGFDAGVFIGFEDGSVIRT
jgi:hypothetical protein